MHADELTSGWDMWSGPNESLLWSQSAWMQITDERFIAASQ